MTIWGLTGSFGSGKSTVAGMLERRGARIIDADRIAREVVMPGRPALKRLAELLGPEALNADGTLNRALAGRRMFADSELRRQIEALLHPAIRRAELRLLERYRDEPLVVLMAPLFYEKDMTGLVDRVLVVACGEAALKERARKRHGLTDAEIDARLNAQMPQAEKRRRADAVIDNSRTLEDTEKQLERLFPARTFQASARGEG